MTKSDEEYIRQCVKSGRRITLTLVKTMLECIDGLRAENTKLRREAALESEQSERMQEAGE